MGRSWLNALIALSAFAGACFIIHRLSPMRDVPMAKPKLDYFQKHKDTFDVVFIGTSRVFHAVIPAVFDEEVKRYGHSMTSFNFGLDGMSPLESRALLEKVLAMKPARLRWIVVESSHVHLAIRKDLRDLYWHEWRDTLFACRHLLRIVAEAQNSSNRKEAWDNLVAHVQVFFKHQTNIGAGSEWFAKRKKQDSYTKRAIKARGYAPLKNATPLDAKIMARYYARGNPDGTAMLTEDKVSKEALMEIAQDVEAFGAKPIFLRAPTFRSPVPNWPPPGSRHVLISFGSMVRFPQLFDISARADADHLNEAASAEFTRMLAAEFIKVL